MHHTVTCNTGPSKAKRSWRQKAQIDHQDVYLHVYFCQNFLKSTENEFRVRFGSGSNRFSEPDLDNTTESDELQTVSQSLRTLVHPGFLPKGEVLSSFDTQWRARLRGARIRLLVARAIGVSRPLTRHVHAPAWQHPPWCNGSRRRSPRDPLPPYAFSSVTQASSSAKHLDLSIIVLLIRRAVDVDVRWRQESCAVAMPRESTVRCALVDQTYPTRHGALRLPDYVRRLKDTASSVLWSGSMPIPARCMDIAICPSHKRPLLPDTPSASFERQTSSTLVVPPRARTTPHALRLNLCPSAAPRRFRARSRARECVRGVPIDAASQLRCP
ncbi:hypothetical protein FB451DRAFT_1487064 [Mycena latifolia]|nr:hypothetical protein FB451DRAFT_1487064 [Mycena latifolia]